jgi:hypothetical protein
MRTLALATTVLLALAGCATEPAVVVAGSPPVGHVTIAGLPEQPAHEHDGPLERPAAPMDRDDPAAVAAGLVVEGLAEQDLEVVDLGVDTLAASPSAATVRIAATHQTETGIPHTSVYELDLSRDPEGSWRLVGFRQAQ